MTEGSEKRTIGFIGLGLMGSAMAEMLLDDGLKLVVWNRESEAYPDLEKRGAIIAESPAAVAAQCEVVMVCVIDTQAVRDVTLGTNGIVHGAKPGLIVVDHSTAMPEDTAKIADQLNSAAGIRFIDAPVSGGPAFARARKLTIMAGGSESDLRSVTPLMARYAQNITRMGNVGAGQMTKVLNQAISGVSYVLMAEVVRLAELSGIDAARVPECLAGGHADSVMLNFAYPKMLEKAFDPPASLASQMLKDLKNVSAEAKRFGLNIPLVDSAKERFANYVDSGGGRAETASIYKAYVDE